MSGKCVNIIDFYKLDKRFNVGKEGGIRKYLGSYAFEQNQEPLELQVPEGCNNFDCYTIMSDEIKVDGKMLDLVSEKLNLKNLDFSLAEQENCPKEIYAAMSLKCLPVYKYTKVNDVQNIHTIGYSSVAHADFVGDFDYLQHPDELSLQKVIVKHNCNRFELFDQVVVEVTTNNGDVKLTAKQPINRSVYYVGDLEEVDGKSKTVFARARDGQRIICNMGELINPDQIDYFGHIHPLNDTKEL